jgi:hypothetical protein
MTRKQKVLFIAKAKKSTTSKRIGYHEVKMLAQRKGMLVDIVKGNK